MPAPGDLKPARIEVSLSDIVWDRLFEPVSAAVAAVATRFDRFQFLTIRQYLSLVFMALIALLVVLAL